MAPLFKYLLVLAVLVALRVITALAKPHEIAAILDAFDDETFHN